MIPLTMAPAGEKNNIQKITGKDTARRHLTELGFVVGAEVAVLTAIGSTMVLSIKESRIALDKTMASRIII